jgi:cell wall assembly regulator SMI1
MLATVLAPLWTELTSWLAANAPRTHECVLPAGDPARLTSAEEQLGFPLGPELTEWWHLHDGVYSNIVPGYELLSVNGMLDGHRTELEVNLEEEVNEIAARNLGLADNEAGGPARYFPPEFVPIGHNGAGNYLVADCRPGPEYGCLRNHDHEDRGVIQPPYFESPSRPPHPGGHFLAHRPTRRTTHAGRHFRTNADRQRRHVVVVGLAQGQVLSHSAHGVDY